MTADFKVAKNGCYFKPLSLKCSLMQSDTNGDRVFSSMEIQFEYTFEIRAKAFSNGMNVGCKRNEDRMTQICKSITTTEE